MNFGEGGLRDVRLEPEYRRGHGSLVADFYVPCLRVSREYLRAAGYFTSTSLALVAAGLSAFLAHDGTMRLVASPILSGEDISAMERGVLAKEDAVSRALLRSFEDAGADRIVRDRLGFLAWLVAEDRLQVRVATTEDGQGIYHEKYGLFVDSHGDTVAFTGSPNETRGGLEMNFESIDVFKGWSREDGFRVELKRLAFERLWADEMPGVRTVTLPTAVRDRLLELRPTSPSSRDPMEGEDVRTERFAGATSREAGRAYARDYQLEAVAKWLEADSHGVFAMATGTGKTLTALLGIEELRQRYDRLLVVVVAPYIHLVDQWADQIREFGWLPVVCYGTTGTWRPMLANAISDLRIQVREIVVCVITQSGATSDGFRRELDSAPPEVHRVIIGDEVHGLGSPAAVAALASMRFDSTLGLSATPERWKDEETEAIYGYFGPVVYEFGLERAITAGYLVPYDYHPHFVELTENEFGRYVDVTRKLARLLAQYGASEVDVGEGPTGALIRQRSLILNNATRKIPTLRALLDSQTEVRYSLVYTTPDLLDATVEAVSGRGRRITHRFTFRESPSDRRALLRAFGDGDMDALVAIRCLDQGVDVPRTETAYIMASSSNSREFIQRRGRILRPAPGKTKASIHDFITTPPASIGDDESWRYERALVRREILRFKEFARVASNRYDAESKLLKLQETYGLFDI